MNRTYKWFLMVGVVLLISGCANETTEPAPTTQEEQAEEQKAKAEQEAEAKRAEAEKEKEEAARRLEAQQEAEKEQEAEELYILLTETRILNVQRILEALSSKIAGAARDPVTFTEESFIAEIETICQEFQEWILDVQNDENVPEGMLDVHNSMLNAADRYEVPAAELPIAIRAENYDRIIELAEQMLQGDVYLEDAYLWIEEKSN